MVITKGNSHKVYMVVLLWRGPWLKPLSSDVVESSTCKFCDVAFKDREFVTSCEFCEIGIMHNQCATDHGSKIHAKDIEKKIEFHKDRKLHDYQ